MKSLSVIALLSVLTACNAPINNSPVGQTPYPPNSSHPPITHQGHNNNHPHGNGHSHEPPTVVTPIKPDKPNSYQPPKTHTPDNNTSVLQQALNKYQQRWQQANLQHYEYVFQRGCYCPREVRAAVVTEVVAGKVVKAVVQKTQENLASHLQTNQQTMQYFFDKIQAAIDKNAAKIEVKYNEQYGYPESIFIDYNTRLADEELRLSAKNLRVLPN